MARPPSGNPRNVVVTVRVTKGEEEALRDKYGTPGKAIRAMLNEALKPATSRAAGAAGKRGPDMEAGWVDETQALTGVVEPPKHRHKRGTVIRTEHESGTPVKVYQCAQDGCEKELR